VRTVAGRASPRAARARPLTVVDGPCPDLLRLRVPPASAAQDQHGHDEGKRPSQARARGTRMLRALHSHNCSRRHPHELDASDVTN